MEPRQVFWSLVFGINLRLKEKWTEKVATNPAADFIDRQIFFIYGE